MAPRTSARSGVGVLPPRRPDRPRHRRGHPRPGLRPVQLHRRHRRVPRPVRGRPGRRARPGTRGGGRTRAGPRGPVPPARHPAGHALAVLPDADRDDGPVRGHRAARRHLGRPDGRRRAAGRPRRRRDRAGVHVHPCRALARRGAERPDRLGGPAAVAAPDRAARAGPVQRLPDRSAQARQRTGPGGHRGVRDRAGHRRADRGAGGGARLRDRPVLPARRRGPRDRCDRRGPDAALPRPQLRVRPGDGGVPQRPEQRRPRTARPDRERQGQ